MLRRAAAAEPHFSPAWSWIGYGAGLPSTTRPYAGDPGGIWALAVGAWGDVLATIGALRRTGEPARLLILGWDERIADFARRQDGVLDAHLLRPPDADAYGCWASAACGSAVADRCVEWTAEPLALAGICPDRLLQLQVNPHLPHCQEQLCWHGARLSPEALEWAEGILAQYPGALVLHPYSGSSNSPGSHWPHWPATLEWLLASDETWLLTGAGWPLEWGSLLVHPRLVDLLGRTETMEQVFALSTLARGTITTSNSLSMWTAIAQVPGVVCCTRHFGTDTNYCFYRWAALPNNRMIHWREGLGAFQERVREWLLKL